MFTVTTLLKPYEKCSYFLKICTKVFFFKILSIWEKEWEWEHTQEQGKGRGKQADSPLSMGSHAKLDPRTLRSWPELKSRVRHLTDWATQEPLKWLILKCKFYHNKSKVETKLKMTRWAETDWSSPCPVPCIRAGEPNGQHARVWLFLLAGHSTLCLGAHPSPPGSRWSRWGLKVNLMDGVKVRQPPGNADVGSTKTGPG